ncbi:hypothetical protein [Micromonospora cremea]|uniref:Extracellular repeat, HAF family n=1 Tax=Micromonospora cremea TaxID=709881 RepID=A0A1N5W3R3_9ACTN|nr:hypothetical protein [Micromonospora cremea]SIM79882.1 hypothetical protein SAMN04489832_2135 [Micromonospora cremea]
MHRLVRRALAAGAAVGLLATAAVVAASPATAFPRPPAPSCAIETLPQPPNMYRTEAYAIDPTGRYVAGGALRVHEESPTEAFLLLWDRGRLTTVPWPNGDGVVDVNARGVVIGNGNADGRTQPWSYRNGVFTLLPTPSDQVYVSAINAAGDVVGYRFDDATGGFVALRWPASRPGTVEELDAPAGALALGVTRDGSIVGTASGPEYFTGWVRHPDGRYSELTVPAAQSTQVLAAEGRWAVGRVSFSDGDQFPVRWNLRTGVYTQLDRQVYGIEDVNARGVAVGGEWVVPGPTARQLPGGGDRVTISGRAIADDGTVVGFRNTAGKVTAVRWTAC